MSTQPRRQDAGTENIQECEEEEKEEEEEEEESETKTYLVRVCEWKYYTVAVPSQDEAEELWETEGELIEIRDPEVQSVELYSS